MSSLLRGGPDPGAASLPEQRLPQSKAGWEKGAFLVAVLLAAALRFPDLALRPMHADEAVHADKLGTLLEGGGYAYDPEEYHGPTLYYLTLLPAWLRGEARYLEIDEVTLRSVPAAIGVALVAAHLGAAAFLGVPGAAAAALLAAISPAMVFYSRYYIHEMPLVCFSFGALLAACAYLRRPSAPAALVAGVCAGLMYATKETALLALGAMLLALAATLALERGLGGPGGRPEGLLAPIRGAVTGRHAWWALLAAALVSSAFFSSFLDHPRGVLDSVRAYVTYAERASAPSWHIHPWDYYLRLLIHFPAGGTPFWTEALILVLAAAGALAGWRASGLSGADAKTLRFLSVYSLVMVVVYSAIPYKTPWCLLGFLHGMILLAGAGAVVVVRAARAGAMRAAVCGLLLAGAAQLGLQAWAGSFRFAADPRNPYVYAQTGTDVFEIVGRLRELARAHPDGPALPIQVVSRANLWPLPFYLRGFSRVEWWNGVSAQAKSAPVILATPDMEPALSAKLYEQPPPGERELYMSLFQRPVELRPAVELRGYVALGLFEASRRLGADSLEPPHPAPRP